LIKGDTNKESVDKSKNLNSIGTNIYSDDRKKNTYYSNKDIPNDSNFIKLRYVNNKKIDNSINRENSKSDQT